MNREEILTACTAELNTRSSRLSSGIAELQAANADNSKSTAGDKHETSRAMVHLELEKLGNQLKLVEQMQSDLEKVKTMSPTGFIRFGSVVETNRGYFLLGVACGKFNVEQTSVFGLGMLSPLAKQLTGKEKGATLSLNGNSFSVLSIM